MRLLDVAEIEHRLEKARDEVGALCKGKHWRMSIPANRNEDSDLIIAASLRDIVLLLDEIKQLNRIIDTLQDAVLDLTAADD